MIEHIYNTNGLGSIISKPTDDGRYFYFKPADGKKITKITVIEKGVWNQGLWEGDPYDSTQTISLDVIWEEGLKGVVKLFFLSSRPLWDGSVTVNVEGEDEQIDIVVFGDTEHQEQRAFSIATSSTNTDTWIYRKTSNAHTYTKAVGFNDEYRPDGNSTPSKYALISLYLQTSAQGYKYVGANYLTWHDSSTPLDIIYDCPYTYTSNEILIHPLNEKPRSIVLYVDSFLAIFSSILMYHESEDKKKCDSINTYTTYSTKKSDYCSLDAELGDFDSVLGQMNVGGQIKMYDKTLQQNNVTYPSIELYDAYRQSLQIDPSIKWDENAATMESKTIPDEHRWVKMCTANFSTHNISPVTHIVKYVYPKNNVGTQPIGDQIGVVSQYSRFTNFWISTPYYYDTEKKNIQQQRRVIGETNSIINNPLMFQIYYPIYKPWAETHLIVFCGETDGPFSDKTYKKIEDVLEMNYEKKYVKRWFVDVENASSKSFATTKHYARTVSPFRNEIYLTHGARDEYDENLFVSEGQDNKLMGNCGIYCGMNTNTQVCRFITPHGFQKMHNIMKAWNDSIHLGIYMECCYGGGIQKGVQRNILRNGLPQNPSDLFDDIDDVWFFISTLATHVDYGYGDRMSFLPHVLNNIYTSISKPSYMELSNNINGRVQNLKQNIFREISIFYHENFNTMYYLLPDEQAKENWLLTHDLIEEDLENLGRCYFASQDWKKTGIDFNMSDNYFHGIAKKIPIHSGFVGFMTNLLLNASYCPYSRQFEPFFKHGFTPYTGDGGLNEIPSEQPGTDLPIDIEDVEEMTTLSEKIRLLNNNIRTYYDNNFSGNYGYTYNPIFSILEPTMKCFGQFTKTSAQFMRNPDEEEDSWLTNDVELDYLCSFEWVKPKQ